MPLPRCLAERPLPTLDGRCVYAEGVQALPLRAPLRGAQQAQACVVGAGIAGLCAALALAGQGLQVTLLEARRVASGASGRNGGQALADYACGIEALERRLGPPAALRAWQLAELAVQRLRQRIAEHAIDCDWTCGTLSVARTPRDAARLHAALRHRQQQYAAAHLRWLDAAQVRRHVESPLYHGGVYDPHGAQLQPLLYTLGLARAALRLGVVLHEQSPVLRIERGADGYLVHCADGSLRAPRLLLATGAVPGAPLRRLRARVLPVATCMLATEPLARPVLHGAAPPAVCDTSFIPDYYRQDAAGRLLFGSGAYHGGRVLRDPAVRRRLLRQAMLRVFPQLQHARITHDWGGWIDASANRAPDFGRVGPDAVYVQGFSGHGLALSGLAGELAAQALLAGPAGCADFELFAALRHASLPGRGLLRRPVAALGEILGRLQQLL